MTKRSAAVLWTGGKDSCLALHRAQQEGFSVQALVTVVPPQANFRAHPLGVIRAQAAAVGLPHHELEIVQPYAATYRAAILSFAERFGVSAIVTGDIGEVDGHANWVRERCADTGIEVVTPLWGGQRRELLESFINLGFRAIFSCVKAPPLSPDWLGRELDSGAVDTLQALSRDTGLDISGEQGEYHTIVLDGPFFKNRLVVDGTGVDHRENLYFLQTAATALREKS